MTPTLQGVLGHGLYHRVGAIVYLPILVSHRPIAALGNGGSIKGGGYFPGKMRAILWRGASYDVSRQISAQLKDGRRSQVRRVLVWCQEDLLEVERNFLEILSVFVGPWN